MLNKHDRLSLRNQLLIATATTVRCETFRLLGDGSRYRIMKTLLAAGELCVSDLADIVGISMSATSQHLRLLELAGLVTGERLGQTICYKPRLNNPEVKMLSKLIS